KRSGERWLVRLKSSRSSTLFMAACWNWLLASKILRRKLEANKPNGKELSPLWRVIVIGGHTRSIGKTQLVCDVIAAFPNANWMAGKIMQYGHGVCAQNGANCDCVLIEHVCAFDWELHVDIGTDSFRFLVAGVCRSFWLRTKQGYFAEGLPLLRAAI